MKLSSFILRRLILLVFVLFGVAVLVFLLTRAAPGIDPIFAYVTPNTPSSAYPVIREQHHLNDPLYVQIWYWFWDVLHGDLGYSPSAGMPVSMAAAIFFPATAELTIAATIISLSVAIPLGILSALKSNKWQDHATRLFVMTSSSMAVFWLGLMLQFVFFYLLRVNGLPSLPPAGRISPDVLVSQSITHYTGLNVLDSVLNGNLPYLVDSLSHLVLPATTLALVSMGLTARIMRSSMLEVLGQDYITMARGKGLPERVVIYKHAFKNAMLPTTTVVGLSFASLLSGAVLTEKIFAWNGMGSWAANAALANDTVGIIGFTLVTATIFVCVNLVVDIVYAILDPRISY
ncbi:MAG: ABC transporter permease [Thaumarchaeota archaeon]|nr:ABC transporter permease [Nitrososphaerota archaeon]